MEAGLIMFNATGKPIFGKYVVIQLQGDKLTLWLREVSITCTGKFLSWSCLALNVFSCPAAHVSALAVTEQYFWKWFYTIPLPHYLIIDYVR